ncbi:hypothetical protein [Streptomyces sp. NPDC046261]|uniref:hypothetical protein n=1 Tax=Streptomyces sp. NPDC046261 TaxID=3157200 RepID=UPI0033F7F534
MAPSIAPGLRWDPHATLLGGSGLEGGHLGRPALAPHADDRLACVVRTRKDGLARRHQNQDGSWSQKWDAVDDTQGTVAGDPTALRGPNGVIHVFWRDPDGGLWTQRQAGINAASAWSSPTRLLDKGVAGDPTAALNADGRISVFYTNSAKGLSLITQEDVSYRSAWLRPYGLGGDVRSGEVALPPAVVRNGQGRLFVFRHDDSHQVCGRAQTKADGITDWGDWFRVSAPGAEVKGAPAAVTDANQYVRVFWRSGTTGHHCVARAGHRSWESPQKLPGETLATPRPILAQDGRLEVYQLRADGQFSVSRQEAVNGGVFSQADAVGGTWSDVVPARLADNRVLVALRGLDGLPHYQQQAWA